MMQYFILITAVPVWRETDQYLDRKRYDRKK